MGWCVVEVSVARGRGGVEAGSAGKGPISAGLGGDGEGGRWSIGGCVGGARGPDGCWSLLLRLLGQNVWMESVLKGWSDCTVGCAMREDGCGWDGLGGGPRGCKRGWKREVRWWWCVW